ncbi:MAG TPA: hypothetical protein PKD16_02165 [Saprospiraceae bacterium]|jgi:hypothetical protein|nr:hypothetical protein [Saprospiraceae bacterium]
MNENTNPETTPETTSKLAFLKKRNVRIALAATAVAGVAFVAYKTKTKPELAEEVLEAAVTA